MKLNQVIVVLGIALLGIDVQANQDVTALPACPANILAKITAGDTNFSGMNLEGSDLRACQFKAGSNFSNARLKGAKLYAFQIQNLPVIPPIPKEIVTSVKKKCKLPPLPPLPKLKKGQKLPPPPPLPKCASAVKSTIAQQPAQQKTITVVLAGNFTNVNFTGADLTGVILTDPVSKLGPDLSGANFAGALMDGADISYATLSSASQFNPSTAKGLVANGVMAPGVQFATQAMDYASFRHAHLDGAVFNGNHLSGADFTAAYIPNAQFSNITGAPSISFETAYVNANTKWSGGDLTGANFTELQPAPVIVNGTVQTDSKGNLLPDSANEGASFSDVKLDSANFAGIAVGGLQLNGISAIGTTFANADIKGGKPWIISNGSKFYATDFSNGTSLSLTMGDDTPDFTAANFKNTSLANFDCSEYQAALAEANNTDTGSMNSACLSEGMEGEF